MQLHGFSRRGRISTLLASALLLLAAPAASADELPGKGVRVQPLQSSVVEEAFQTLIICRGLEALGYEVAPAKELEYAPAHVAIANGDATFMAAHWDPLHIDFYEKAGGDAKLTRNGVYIPGSLQGYLIDKKTADDHGIKNLGQLEDPKIAALFDADGDGKADLAGCNPGWGCEGVIEHHLDAYGLRDRVTHKQGTYAAIIADTIARFRAGGSILYYTWTPYWVSALLRPGREVVWLEVPFSSLPGSRKGVDTTLSDGSNYGFQLNKQRIVANKAWADANPAAAKLFEVMRLPLRDVNAQNLRMHRGERADARVSRHVDGWIMANQATFDRWLALARAAAAGK